MKEYEGGFVSLGGANWSASLRGLSAARVLCDEVNDWKDDVDGQGDPLVIAEKNAANFPSGKVGIFGNPGIKDHSKIEHEYHAGDQRRYFIPCAECGHKALLTWNGRPWFSDSSEVAITCHRIEWDKTPDGRPLPRTAHMICCECGARVEESRKQGMLERGEWRATAEGDGETRSYQISALYSPLGFQTWATSVVEYLRAKRKPDGLRAWVNNNLGETWEGEVEQTRRRASRHTSRGTGQPFPGASAC